MKHRLFLSIGLPVNIRHAFDYKISELQKGILGGIKFVDPQSRHFTILFLGDQDDIEVGKIIEALSPIAPLIDAPEITINKICYGPDLNNPRLIWATTNEDSSQALSNIKEKVTTALLAANVRFKIETRRFHGHITLARLDRLTSELPKLDQPFSESFTVQSMELMESELKSGGSEYAIMASWTFREE